MRFETCSYRVGCHWLFAAMIGSSSLLLPTLSAEEHHALKPALDQAVKPVASPPQYMQNLAPDYLERLHASLVAGTGRLGKLRDTKANESIGWVRSGMPALILPPNLRSATPAYLRVYFSHTLADVQEDGGWIFVKDGGAFAAVKVVAGGYQWTPAWKHANSIDVKPFVTLDTENAPVILITNQAADYNRDFEAFKAAVKAQPIRYADGELHFATLTFQGTARPGEVDGQPVNLAPSRGYDSPFIRSDWNSGIIYIRKGSDTEILDFRDANNPVKTIGAPVISAFGSGIGTARPIIFGTSGR